MEQPTAQAGLAREAIGLREVLFQSGLAAQVDEDLPKILQDVSGRLLKLGDLLESALIAQLPQLEALEVDEHGGQGLGDSIMKLPS